MSSVKRPLPSKRCQTELFGVFRAPSFTSQRSNPYAPPTPSTFSTASTCGAAAAALSTAAVPLGSITSGLLGLPPATLVQGERLPSEDSNSVTTATMAAAATACVAKSSEGAVDVDGLRRQLLQRTLEVESLKKERSERQLELAKEREELQRSLGAEAERWKEEYDAAVTRAEQASLRREDLESDLIFYKETLDDAFDSLKEWKQRCFDLAQKLEFKDAEIERLGQELSDVICEQDENDEFSMPPPSWVPPLESVGAPESPDFYYSWGGERVYVKPDKTPTKGTGVSGNYFLKQNSLGIALTSNEETPFVLPEEPASRSAAQKEDAAELLSADTATKEDKKRKRSSQEEALGAAASSFTPSKKKSQEVCGAAGSTESTSALTRFKDMSGGSSGSRGSKAAISASSVAQLTAAASAPAAPAAMIPVEKTLLAASESHETTQPEALLRTPRGKEKRLSKQMRALKKRAMKFKVRKAYKVILQQRTAAAAAAAGELPPADGPLTKKARRKSKKEAAAVLEAGLRKRTGCSLPQ